jgi:hypothetical protein
MRKSPILAFCLALAAGYLLATALNRPSVGQPPALEPLPAPQPAAVWRYQVTIAREGNYPLLILTDTTTGHVWVHESNPHDRCQWTRILTRFVNPNRYPGRGLPEPSYRPLAATAPRGFEGAIHRTVTLKWPEPPTEQHAPDA